MLKLRRQYFKGLGFVVLLAGMLILLFGCAEVRRDEAVSKSIDSAFYQSIVSIASKDGWDPIFKWTQGNRILAFKNTQSTFSGSKADKLLDLIYPELKRSCNGKIVDVKVEYSYSDHAESIRKQAPYALISRVNNVIDRAIEELNKERGSQYYIVNATDRGKIMDSLMSDYASRLTEDIGKIHKDVTGEWDTPSRYIFCFNKEGAVEYGIMSTDIMGFFFIDKGYVIIFDNKVAKELEEDMNQYLYDIAKKSIVLNQG